MQKTTIDLPEIKLVGITARTNLANEINPITAKITPTIQQYFSLGLPEKIAHRKNPSKTFCVYTEYESDYTGDYTFFIGQEVTAFENLPEGTQQLTIQPQPYVKFTTEPGTMPNVVIQAWQNIWQMTPQDLKGIRAYHADFEVYDERALDPQNTVLDLYVGMEK